MKKINFSYLVLAICLMLGFSCSAGTKDVQARKIGILLVAHGAKAESWNQAIRILGDSVSLGLQNEGKIEAVKTAFMEVAKPSIADELRSFDAEGYTDVILVPIFLTLSSHTSEDIPVICGLKEDSATARGLREEGTEIYQPKARLHMAPQLDFGHVLEDNVVRRVESMSVRPKEEGVLLVGYGEGKEYSKRWTDLFNKVSASVEAKTGIDKCLYAWCGHLVHFSPQPTTDAVEKILQTKKTAIVIPVLISRDDLFQGRVIGGGVKAVPDSAKRVRYQADSILPDPEVTAWVISIAEKMSEGI